ncbi:DUF885 domain-containing protein [Massilia sp. P8910]|uniref:DUF885 domain-containing protein n=1 Tax=Massilia antarctica TaxID=2765360 RepID=UPI001E43E245|nr:DUF885 domain-containing protein [Massilia antarctica]MCE3604605.1 DUF885 domain-containing protein [Massilia antarctica]
MTVLRSLLLSALLGSSVVTALPLHAAEPLAAGAADPAKTAVAAPAVQLAELAERYYEEQARYEPVNATVSGDNRFDDLLPMNILPSVRARQFAMLHEVRDALARIDRSKLSALDLTTYDILGFEVNNLLRFESFKDYLLPMSHMDSLPVLLANFGAGDGSQPLVTVANYQAYLKRITALPQWTDAAIANMRAGIKQGVVQPKALVQALLPQIKALAAATVDTSAFSAPARALPASFSKGEKARMTGAYREAVRVQVLPSLRKLAAFLETEYLPAARDTAGWGSLPDGGNWYRAWVAAQTTSALSPEEIHRIGLAEMTRINAEFTKLAPKLGYTGTPAGLPRWLTQQPKYRPFKTEEEVLQAYRALNARILPMLPRLFATLPKAPLEIRAEPALSRDTASDHYTAAAGDGSRPGIFWAVIPDPARYASTRMTSLFLHEGQPGHHFQLSKQQELPIPKFRKFGGNNAYVEGWALYAESLGKEMGLYEDPNAYAGHLMLDMMRAARLVVDTGLHAQGWTREQTIRFLVDEAGSTEDDARNATERYMAWPGQALGYKVGALKIMELRQRAQSALGDKFSLAKFHDAVLADGTLPLALLETKINSWIAQQAK